MPADASPNLLRAVAAPRRQQILRLIWQQERSVGQIRDALGDLSLPAVSQHLAVLAQLGVVRARREGVTRYYQAVPSELGPLRRWLEASWADALADLKLLAEVEADRRGPTSRARRPVRRHPRRARRKP